MSYNKCAYCENESRLICVKCKKDVCKEHASYERDQDGHGEWVCTDCHKTSNVIALVAFAVFIVIIIIVLIFLIPYFNNFF